jgi:hypothetical protein
MNNIRRTSLAEFSRLYLHPPTVAPNSHDDPIRHVASAQPHENSFAAQVVLGMSKTTEKSPLKERQQG